MKTNRSDGEKTVTDSPETNDLRIEVALGIQIRVNSRRDHSQYRGKNMKGVCEEGRVDEETRRATRLVDHGLLYR
jgi:hypothetical protein